MVVYQFQISHNKHFYINDQNAPLILHIKCEHYTTGCFTLGENLLQHI